MKLGAGCLDQCLQVALADREGLLCGSCAAVSGPITQGTTNLITVLLLPVAIAMIAYALTTFYARSIYLQRKQVRAHAGCPACPRPCGVAMSPCSLHPPLKPGHVSSMRSPDAQRLPLPHCSTAFSACTHHCSCRAALLPTIGNLS